MFARRFLSVLILFMVVEIYNGKPDILREYFTNQELTDLMHLRDYLCGFSFNFFNDSNHDPWFCVKPEDCVTKGTAEPPGIKLSICKSHFPREGRDTCCLIGNIHKTVGWDKEKLFTADPYYFGVWTAEKESFSDYWNALYSLTHEYLMDILSAESVCALIPSGIDEKKNTMYTPHVCKSSLCSSITPAAVKEGLASIKTSEIYEPGNQFCSKSSKQGYCCHPGVALSEERSSSFDSINWKLRVLKPDQKYAPGFRSSLKCEQYSRSVCEKKADRCSLRVVNRTIAIPGEVPHQALIGIQEATMRFFHCSGSLVSRYYILSSMLCRFYDKVPASVALLGEYNIHEASEFGQHEVITYISQSIEEPRFRPNEKTYKQAHLMLFRLWRPVEFHHWLRPACINWKTDFKSKVNETPLFPEEVLFSGYGTSVIDGRLSKTLKKSTFPADSCLVDHSQINKKTLCLKCQDAFYNVEGSLRPYRHFIDVNEVFCLGFTPVHVDESTNPPQGSSPWGPCQFDLGAPASAMERNTTPYCQWKVFGVNVNPKDDCLFNSPSLFRIVGGVLLPWLEEAIWKDDFFVHELDMSYPACHDSKDHTFRDMIHLDPKYDRFYAK